MFQPSQISPDLLQKLGKDAPEGSVIFRQGDYGKTMLFIVSGFVRVYYNEGTVEHLVGIVGPGEVIGEKAILDDNPYRRSFFVQAKTQATFLEIDAKGYKLLQTKHPDLTLLMLKQVLNRLNKANELIKLLQMNEPLDRFLKYVQYYFRHHNAHVPENFVVPMSLNEIRFAANIEKHFAEECMNDLVGQSIVKAVPGGFTLINDAALENYAPTFREKHAA